MATKKSEWKSTDERRNTILFILLFAVRNGKASNRKWATNKRIKMNRSEYIIVCKYETRIIHWLDNVTHPWKMCDKIHGRANTRGTQPETSNKYTFIRRRAVNDMDEKKTIPFQMIFLSNAKRVFGFGCSPCGRTADVSIKDGFWHATVGGISQQSIEMKTHGKCRFAVRQHLLSQ